MEKKKPAPIPKLTRHKASGRGYVRLNGVCHYLGKYEDPETQEKALRLIAEWLANGRKLPVAPEEITVAEVVAAYWTHCKEYYRTTDGGRTSSLAGIKQALRPVRQLYGTQKACEFGPKALRAIRQTWIDSELTRTTINTRVGYIKRMFKWAVSHEMISSEVHVALSTVEGLRKGRSAAKEPRKILPVPNTHVKAIKPYVSRQVWGLIQLQLLTGARPGELLQLRRIDIDTTGNIWIASLSRHKTSYVGHEREVLFGPQAQEVLKSFFPGKDPVDYLFSPQDARREKGEQAETHRRPDQKPNPRRTDRRVGEFYTTSSYHRAIARACKLAKVPRWQPNRLRHTAGIRIRKEFGLDAAQAVLGHAHADVTQVYAEVNRAKAVSIMASIG